jgi:hypothetical protein
MLWPVRPITSLYWRPGTGTVASPSFRMKKIPLTLVKNVLDVKGAQEMFPVK